MKINWQKSTISVEKSALVLAVGWGPEHAGPPLFTPLPAAY